MGIFPMTTARLTSTVRSSGWLRAHPLLTSRVDGVHTDRVQVLQEIPSGSGGKQDAAALRVGEAAVLQELDASLHASPGPRNSTVSRCPPRWPTSRALGRGPAQDPRQVSRRRLRPDPPVRPSLARARRHRPQRGHALDTDTRPQPDPAGPGRTHNTAPDPRFSRSEAVLCWWWMVAPTGFEPALPP